MRKVRIGISGLSNSAVQNVIPAFLKMMDVEIVGAFDPDISKFDKANAALGTNLKFFNSYQELCFYSDAVIICAPESVRLSQAKIAMEMYGDFVMLEEPAVEDSEALWEKYGDIFDSADFTYICFFDPSDSNLCESYQSFVDKVVTRK